jgi:hypothetical protein
MTQGDILAKFGTIDTGASYIVDGTFLMKLQDLLCRINPIGPNTKEQGTSGTEILGGGSGNGIPDPSDKTKAYVLIWPNSPNDGPATWFQAPGPNLEGSSGYGFTVSVDSENNATFSWLPIYSCS